MKLIRFLETSRRRIDSSGAKQTKNVNRCLYFVNFSSAHAAVKIFIGKKLGIFNEVVRKIEAAGKQLIVYSPPGLVEGEGEGERPRQRERGRPKKTGGERYQPIGILTQPGTK
jgi:hypothetical protein